MDILALVPAGGCDLPGLDAVVRSSRNGGVTSYSNVSDFLSRLRQGVCKPAVLILFVDGPVPMRSLHEAGDDVLVAFTQCVQASLRDYDCVGRYGGEEFVVIAAGSSGQSDEVLYERLRAQVADTEVKTKAGTISVTVSIGVAPGTGQSTVDALLAAADAALYQAKAGGGNRVANAIHTNVLLQIAGTRQGGSRQ